MPWKTLSNEDDKPLFEWQLETVVKGFFNRELLLDYIRYFILFESDGKRLIKKIAAYHQFHAVREAVTATIVASTGVFGALLGGILLKWLPLRSSPARSRAPAPRLCPAPDRSGFPGAGH